MRKRLFVIQILLVITFAADAQGELKFQSLQEVFAYADSHSSTFKNATQQSILAKYQTLAAKLAQWNFKSDASFSSIDNTKLPVSYLPGEIFGGPAGTFKTITLGQPYVSTLNIAPQIDVLNPYNMARIRVAKAYEKVTDVNNLLSKKSLYESLAGTFYNILSYQWQIKVTQKSLLNLDTLVSILQQKQQAGIARMQDVNNVVANQFTTRDKLQQLGVMLAQQYNSLKILCDIDAVMPVLINAADPSMTAFDGSLAASGHLQQTQTELQKKYEEEDYRAAKRYYMPTVSAVGNLLWQQNSRKQFYDNNTWVSSNYIGFKILLPLVPDANKFATVKYDRINLVIADVNLKHAILQDSIDNEQLKLDYQKAFNSYDIAGKIDALRQDSYQKNLDIYKQGILSATDLLLSFNDWLNSSLNTVAQLANSEYAKSKININNTVK
jgi:outer membrane protein TolC